MSRLQLALLRAALQPLRQTGRTTAQIKAAPPGSVFVWPNEKLDYVRQLALDHVRSDLMIRHMAWIASGSYRGFQVPIVLDHACFEEPWSDAFNASIYYLMRTGRINGIPKDWS